MSDKYLGFFALLGTAFIYGIFGIIVRSLNPYLTANQMTFLRSIIVGAVLAIVLMRKKTSIIAIPKKSIVPLFFHSITFGATVFLFTYAALLTSLSKATFSFYSTTLITSLLVSLLVFKEGFTPRKGVSFFLAMAGLVCFVLPSGIRSIDIGMTFTGIAGISDVITNSMKKYLAGKIDRLVLVFYQMLTGAVLGCILVFIAGDFSFKQPLTLESSAWLLFFAFNFFLLSYLTAYGFQHFDLNLGTIILSLEFVFASLVGYIVYNETMTTYQLAASGFLISSIIVMNIPSKNKAHAKK